MEHQLSFTVGLVLVLGVISQWLSWIIRIPSILVLAIVGIIIGPVTGLIQPSQDMGPLFEPFVKLSLAVVLFEGGLLLQFHELKEAGKGVRRLVTVNTVLSLVVVTLLAMWVLDVNYKIASIISAILVVTGPTVIIPMIKNAKLPRKLSSYLKWEGIINDPVGVILAILLLEYFTIHKGSLSSVFRNLSISIFMSVLLSFSVSFVIKNIFRKGMAPQYLKLPIILVSVITVYTIPNFFQEDAGLVATTLFGIILGNSKIPILDELKRFKEYLTVLLVPIVFILLTADVQMSTFSQISWRMVLFFLLIMFVVRPITVYFSTLKSDITFKEMIFVSIIAPRGIVCAALSDYIAYKMVNYGYKEASDLLPTMFLIIFGSVIVCSLLVNFLAGKLELSYDSERVLIIGSNAWTVDLATAMQNMGIQTTISDSSWGNLRVAKMNGIPTHYGEVLSTISEEDMDLTDVGHVLAATGNDAYNALVCTRYAHHLGHSKVHQVAFESKKGHEFKNSFKGAFIVSKIFTYEYLLKNHFRGGKFKVIDVGDVKSEENNDQTVTQLGHPILVMKSDGAVIFNSVVNKLKYLENDKVLIYCV